MAGQGALDGSFADWLEGSRAWTDERLGEALDELDLGPERHAEALRYALFGGGKRLRPALVRLVCLETSGDDANAAAPAVAIELVHTYSLVHDDLPCMDDDDLRRGRPTCHVVYGEGEGVLVGDSLLTMAFEWLARRGGPRSAELAAVLASAAGPAGMVGGQSLDLAAAAGACSPDDVREIHRRKTASLVGAAAELGAIAGGADASLRAAYRRYGLALGRSFQAVDDVLDVTGDARTLGKTPGKDQAAAKATLVSALGLDGARAEARRWADEARSRVRHAGATSLSAALVEHILERSS